MRQKLLLLFTGFVAGCAFTAFVLSVPFTASTPVVQVAEQPAQPVAETTQPRTHEIAASVETAQTPPVQNSTLSSNHIAQTAPTAPATKAPLPRAEAHPPSEQATHSSIAFFPSTATKRRDNAASGSATGLPPIKVASPDVFSKNLLFASEPSRFSLLKMGTAQTKDEPTLLVIGGIQGDEPGGFSAATLLSTRYSIERGQVWIVPDLNFASILKRDRGIHGDMNRKFAHLDAKDPEYSLISELKQVLLDTQVDLVLNLHDGSGFYRPTYENARFNPNRWGQSVIIDQREVEANRFNRLHTMAEHAQEDVNRVLVHPDHRYFIRNTETRLGDKEMEKSLSYFVVLNGKAAFGIEASKEFTTEFRAYYHLTAIESFMRQMGISFTRSFDLSPRGVLAALNTDLTLALFNNKIVLPLDNVRPSLANIPFNAHAQPKSRASRPLLALVNEKDGWRVAYGNRTLTRVQAAPMPFDDSLHDFDMIIDGVRRTVQVGEVIPVHSSFTVCPLDEYRVNAIGAIADKNGTEAGVELNKTDFLPRYSVDKDASLYRVEVYKGKAFAGMVLVSFDGSRATPDDPPLTAVKGPESALGY